jgi:hypothetical protein
LKFQEFLDEHKVSYVTDGKYATHGWIQFDCPFCDGGSDPNKPYCGYNLSGNYINCWRCGGHSIAQTMKALSGLSWKEIKALVGNIEVDRSTVWTPVRGNLAYPDGLVPLKKVHRKYLKGRGFDPDELVRLWGIQGIGLAPSLSWRLFIPITQDGQVVSWTTRKVSDNGSSSRYISASPSQEIRSAKECLYGIDYARHGVVIVEGPTDVWRVGPGSIAVLGTGIKPAQLLRLSKFLIRAVCFDNEPAGRKRARMLCDSLSAFPGSTTLVELDAKDPGSASPKEIKLLRKEFLE